MCAIFGGKFYGSKVAKNGDILNFTDAGAWVDSQYKKDDGTPRKQYQIGVEFGGAEYTVNLNGTSINNIIPVYGKDSQEWVGKQVKVEIVKAMVAGKMKDMIILHPIEIASEDQTQGADWGEDK